MKKKNDISKKDIQNWVSADNGVSANENIVDLTEDALISFAQANALAPPPSLKATILNRLRILTEQNEQKKVLDINNLPLLDENSNWLEWQALTADIAAPDDYEDIYLHTLESNEQRELFVAFVKEFVPEEVHYDLLESFLLLEGSCECHIINEAGGTRIVRLGEGEYIAMEIGEKHDIYITSGSPAKAILQWRKLAA